MRLLKTILTNLNKPAPRWFRKFRKVLNNTLNFIIALLLILGYADDGVVLLIIKLGQSFIMEQLDTLMGNGEVYAKADTLSVITEKTTTIVDTIEPNNN